MANEPTDSSLEGRVLIVSDEETFSKINYFMNKVIKNVSHATSLENVALAEYGAIVLTSRNQLDDQNIQKNYQTPVIYCTSDEKLAAELGLRAESLQPFKEMLIHDKNLFSISAEGTLVSSVNDALQVKEKLKAYLSTYSKKIAPKMNLEHPRFKNALQLVKEDEELRGLLDTENRKLPVAKAIWPWIKERMHEYTTRGDEIFKKIDLAKLVMNFLHQYDRFERTKTVFPLGEEEVGEDRVTQVHTNLLPAKFQEADMQYQIFREIEPRGKISAKDIAEQRYKDAKYMSQFKEFKVPLLLRPLHLQNGTSFVVMQYIAGLPLYKVLLQLNSRYDEETDEKNKARVHLLRKSLLEKHLDSCAFWINNCTDTFFPKPKPDELIQYYRERISEIPASFSARTGVQFTPQETELWNEVTNFITTINFDSNYIVRNRDSGFNNAIIHLSKKQLSADYLDIFGVTSRDKMDSDFLNDSFFNIDMQYRYGHVLEDLAQLLTFYESSFLLRNKKNKFTSRPQNILNMRERFFSQLDQKTFKDIKNDDLSFYSMLLYRTVRKMFLFTDYWAHSCLRRETNKILPREFENRRERFNSNLSHHYLLGKGLCSRVGDLIKQTITEKDEFKQAESLRKKLYWSASTDNAPLIETALSSFRSGMSQPALNYVRVYALRMMLEKIESGLAQAGLKYCPTESPSFKRGLLCQT